MTPIRLVAFDLDDTLVSERAFVASGFRAVSEYLVRAGIVDRPVARDLQAAFDAGVRRRTFDHVLEARGVEATGDLVRTLVEVYRSHRSPYGDRRPDITLYPDADRALADLRAAGVRTAVVSDGPLVAQQAKVEALDLARRLDAVVLTDAWGSEFWKPHPRAFLWLADRFGLAPGQCLYVADNPAKDFEGPARAGWHASVRVWRSDGLHRDDPLADPGRVCATVEGLADLPGFIESLSRSG